jgi:hypothetical protein
MKLGPLIIALATTACGPPTLASLGEHSYVQPVAEQSAPSNASAAASIAVTGAPPTATSASSSPAFERATMTALPQARFAWHALALVKQPDPEPRGKRLAELVCRAMARLGPPQSTEYYDLVFEARSAGGSQVGLRVDPEYSDLELLAGRRVARAVVAKSPEAKKRIGAAVSSCTR